MTGDSIFRGVIGDYDTSTSRTTDCNSSELLNAKVSFPFSHVNTCASGHDFAGRESEAE